MAAAFNQTVTGGHGQAPPPGPRRLRAAPVTVTACVRACVRACVCVCVYERVFVRHGGIERLQRPGLIIIQRGRAGCWNGTSRDIIRTRDS